MKMCLQSIQLSILVNGDPVGQISPGRGLKLGTHYHPTFLYYVLRVFQHYLYKVRREVISMESRCVEGLHPSHIFYLLMTVFCFAGLLIKKLLFLRRSLTLMVLLQVNLLTINYQKSKILFSSNTIQHQKSIISTFLGVTESIGSSKYLGFLSIIGK